jgi:hypothetical protein
MAWQQSPHYATGDPHIEWYMRLEEISQDIDGNASEIEASVWAARTDTGHQTAGTGTVTMGVDGTPYARQLTGADVITETPRALFTKALSVAHDESGAKQVPVSVSFDYTAFAAQPQAFTFALTMIPRGLVGYWHSDGFHRCEVYRMGAAGPERVLPYYMSAEGIKRISG